MCKVSVLIPAYNVEPYIRECLDSVLCQTMSDLEIICVDDASTDGTLDILREYQARDARIQVYCHEKNLGQSCGRNLALSHASGEYVYMLDADDMIVPEALKELYETCSADMLDVAGFETCQFTEDAAFAEEASLKTIVYDECPVMDGREALIYCMEKEAFSLSVPTFMMKRSYLEDIHLKFTEGILHEDVGYIFELITRAGRIRFLHKIYFLRRIRARSTMTKGFTDQNIEGYLKSFVRSFELEDILRGLYKDLAFQSAVRKWQRDIFGRLRQLYQSSEEVIYHQSGGYVDEETRRMFEIVKLVTAGKTQAEAIMGEDTCAFLKKLSKGQEEAVPQVYICGTGQYAERAIDLVGALEIVIRGVIVTEKRRHTFRGFPVYLASEAPDRSIPVIVSVSHYQQDEYEKILGETGFRQMIHVRL